MTILTRETAGSGVTSKGSPLTHAEMDNNLIELANRASGATLSDDTSSNVVQYLGMSRAITGSWLTAYTASTQLYFNPSTGTLNSVGFNSLSDFKLKKNIQPIIGAVYVVGKLTGYEFDWKDNGKKSAGVIAQELEKILPHLVEETDGIKSVNYSGLIGYLIEAIKELDARVVALESK